MPLSWFMSGRFISIAPRETLRFRDVRYLPRSQSQEVVEPDFESRCLKSPVRVPTHGTVSAHIRAFPGCERRARAAFTAKVCPSCSRVPVSAFFNISAPAHYTLKTLSPLILQEGPVRSRRRQRAALRGRPAPFGGRGAVGSNIFPALSPFQSKLCLPIKRAASALRVKRWLYKTPWFYNKEEWLLKPFVCLCVWWCPRSRIFRKQGGGHSKMQTCWKSSRNNGDF